MMRDLAVLAAILAICYSRCGMLSARLGAG